MKIFELVLRSPNSYSLSQKIHSRLNRRVNYWVVPVLLMFAVGLTACGGGGSDPAAATDTNCVIGTSTIGNCNI